MIIHLGLPWIAQRHDNFRKFAISITSPYDMSGRNLDSGGMSISVHLDGCHILSTGKGRDVEWWRTANEDGESERDIRCLVEQERRGDLSSLRETQYAFERPIFLYISSRYSWARSNCDALALSS